jgi:SSS family solute:Na+ symporter
MSLVDWCLFFGFLAYVVWDGTRRARETHDADDYFLAGRSVPWWGMGLSIMATQASAITLVGTTGQGWVDGFRFLQFYYALPLAMLIIAYTAVPLYHRLRIATAYEYLGVRFDAKTRVLSAFLFLILRGLSVGFVIYTPSLVLAKVFSLPLPWMILLMGGAAVLYTSVGGLKAVISTDVKQMTVMTAGVVVAFVALLARIPGEVGLHGALTLAKESGRLQFADFSWNPNEKYTIWSSLLGGLFLFLSYFGTDQSQVQRLLAGRSVRHMRGALLLNAVAKVPFQFLVLGCGVLLFVFHLFHVPALSFEPGAGAAAAEAPQVQAIAEEFAGTRERLRETAFELANAPDAPRDLSARYRSLLAESDQLREEARVLRGGTGDTNYVFLDFILKELPRGVVGLLLAAIFAAALSSIDSELNSMATVAVLDGVQFTFRRRLEGRSLLLVSRAATLAAGAFATCFALFAGQIGSVIEAVNRVGSYLYGSLLGVFVLAMAVRRANGHGAFAGLVAGMTAVFFASRAGLAFLYLNTVGTVVVVVVGTIVSLLTRPSSPSSRRPNP